MSLVAAGVAVGATIVAAVCAAVDGALLGADAESARQLDGEPRDRVHRALSTARTLLLVLAGCAAAIAVRRPGGNYAVQVVVLAVIVALVVFIAESAARSIGDAIGSPLLHRLRHVVRVLLIVLRPLTGLFGRLDAMLRRLMPPPPDDEQDVTAEQFRQVVASAADVAPDEAVMLHGVFSLSDTEVQEIMVPRVDIVGIERTTPWSEVVDRVRSAEHARFPVFDETLDELTGILYAKDLLPAVIADAEPANGWLSLARPAVFIPATKTIDAQLRDFKSSRTHIAVVVDEYGGTAGIVTIEDVLEEIVGEIHDEHDVEEHPVEQQDGRRFWVSGRVSLDELAAVLEHDFEREDVTTVAGLVYEHLGRVPSAGEQFTLAGFRFVVERVRRRRIERIFVERMAALAGRGAA